MADIAGLTVGVLALLDTCVTTCGLISKAKHFSADLESLRIGILWEEGRLKDWARAWELSENGDLQSATLLIEEAKSAYIDLNLVDQTLANIKMLLDRCQEMLARHTSQESTSSNLNSFKKVFKPAASAKSRIQWSVVDATTLRTLLGDLEKQNERLHRLKPRQTAASREVQRIAATSSTISSLDQLGVQPAFQALDGYPEIQQLFAMRNEQDRTEAEGRTWVRSGNLYVKQAEYKVQYDHSSTVATSVRTTGVFTPTKNSMQRSHVLIEWKYFVGSDLDSKQLALSRTERIAELLAAKGKPSGFRILECVGWFVEENKNRCGIMFSIPQNLQLKVGTRGMVHWLSLADLIRAKTRPTLQERFRLGYLLTTSIHELHLAKWLHKNFSSDNIIFSTDEAPSASETARKVDFSRPYIASFGLARPDHHIEVSSIAMSSTPINRGYQHPDYSSKIVVDPLSNVQLPRYHRVYDIYSLGCILLEISLWRNLEDLGWNNRKFTDQPRKWQRHLLDIVEKNVAHHTGPIYRDIVLACLKAEAPGTSRDASSGSNVVNCTETFSWDVIRRLDQLYV